MVGKPEGKEHLEDLAEDGRILEWIIEKYDGKLWIGFIWLRLWNTDCMLRTIGFCKTRGVSS
jgi:hypothetical protein